MMLAACLKRSADQRWQLDVRQWHNGQALDAAFGKAGMKMHIADHACRNEVSRMGLERRT